MIKLAYVSITDNKIIESDFNTLEEAFWFTVKNLTTKRDRDWYYGLTKGTFKEVVGSVDNPQILMRVLFRNAFENLVSFREE